MSYFDKLDTLAKTTQAKALVILDHFKAGRISKTEAIGTMSALISKANLKAAALADFSLAATITLETGQVTPALGVTIQSGGTRAKRAIKQILDTPTADADMAMRIGRLAHSEPLGAAVRASNKALSGQKLVEGWVRKLDPDPCQLCRWWWRDGQVWPKNHPMPHHKGCQCIQEPVFTEQNFGRSTGRKYKTQPVLGG